MKEPSVEEAIRRILSLPQHEKPGPCPDANELAAYQEGSLSSKEAARFEEHVSRCYLCLEALALSLRLAEEERGVQNAGIPGPWRFFPRSFQIRFALAASLVVMLGVLLYRGAEKSRIEQPAAQVALQKPAEEVSLADSATRSARPEPMPAPGGPVQVPSSKDALASVGDRKLEKALVAPNQARVSLAQPTSVLDAVTDSKAVGFTDSRAATPAKTATGEAAENLFKTRQAQIDPQALRLKIVGGVAAPKDQAAASGVQNADKSGRGGGAAQAAQARGNAIQLQALNMSAERRAPQEAVESRLSADTSGKGTASLKQVGDRLFARSILGWIEVECLLSKEAPAREISRSSREYAEWLAHEPALAELPDGMVIMRARDGTKIRIR